MRGPGRENGQLWVSGAYTIKGGMGRQVNRNEIMVNFCKEFGL